MHNQRTNHTSAPRDSLDDYLARQALLLQPPPPAEACTDIGAGQTDQPDDDAASGIVIGVALGLTAWALTMLALLAAYLP